MFLSHRLHTAFSNTTVMSQQKGSASLGKYMMPSGHCCWTRTFSLLCFWERDTYQTSSFLLIGKVALYHSKTFAKRTLWFPGRTRGQLAAGHILPRQTQQNSVSSLGTCGKGLPEGKTFGICYIIFSYFLSTLQQVQPFVVAFTVQLLTLSCH